MYEEFGFTEAQIYNYYMVWKKMKGRDPITREVIKPSFEEFLRQKRNEIEQMKQRGMSEDVKKEFE